MFSCTQCVIIHKLLSGVTHIHTGVVRTRISARVIMKTAEQCGWAVH